MLWEQLAELGEPGMRLLAEEHGYTFLATTSPDGAPRIHPVAPVVTRTGVYLAVTQHSPKLRDLRRDPRIAMHSSVKPPDDEEFALRGSVVELTDDAVRAEIAAARCSGAEPTGSMVLFGLDPTWVCWTVWRDGSPTRRTWRRAVPG